MKLPGERERIRQRLLFLVLLFFFALAASAFAASAFAAPAFAAPMHMDVRAQNAQEQPRHMDLRVPRAQDAPERPRIGVLTMQPGEIFFERFGHNAVVVQEPGGEATSYNYGFFDPAEADFIGRFIRGDMRYRLVALPVEQDLVYYRESGRGVSIQWLDLPDEDAQALADALAQNARPENAHYRYDYFLDNCSTRVRDAVDEALGGALRKQLDGRSRGSTFRSESLRLASPAPWMWLGFDIGLGPAADRPLPLWDEAFVPMRLAAALRDVRNAQGRPLVAEEIEVLPHRLAPEPEDLPRPWLGWTAGGVALALGMTWLGRRRPSVLAGVALPFWFVSGLIGVLSLFIWFGTAHRFGWANQNLLLLNPVAWLLLPGGWRALRGRDPGKAFRWVLLAICAAGSVALFMNWLSVQPQRNLHWIGLILPVHLAAAWVFWRRRPAPEH